MSGASQSLLGGSSSKGSGSSTPINLQNPAFTNLAPGVADSLSNIFGTTNGAPGASFGLSPFQVNGSPSNNTNANPLVAGLTNPQLGFLTGINTFGQNNFGLNGGASAINNILNPNYAAALATGPQTQAAIGSAVQPIINAFKNTTLPGLSGQFTAAGQRTNTGDQNGIGSSAFGRNVNEAENTLEGNVGATAGNIANQAYQTGLQQQSNAINQAAAYSTTNLNNMISALNSVALPQMIQQYGINQGQQLYQQQLNTIMAALGLGGQIAQPSIGNVAQNSYSGSASPGLLNAFGNAASGGANLVKANPFGMFG